MAEAFYPFVDAGDSVDESVVVRYAARIAVYDDDTAAPRVVIVEPTDVRSYLEEITATVTTLAKEQGGTIPFMVIREIVENLIHAFFTEPTISILDGGNTIRFADQGPGIADKTRALEYGTTSATNEMKRYIRGVGSGLPYAQQWLSDKGGTLRIEDNIGRGTLVTISMDGDGLDDADDTMSAYEPAAMAAGVAAAMPAAGGVYAPVAAAPGTGVVAPAAGTSWPTQPAMAPGYGQAMPYGMPLYGQQMPYGQGGAFVPQASGWPQAAGMGMYPQVPGVAVAPRVSERGMMALGYLATHESVGPTELVATFGHSQSTWTRELKALEEAGLVAKRGGQKRYITPAGQAFMAR